MLQTYLNLLDLDYFELAEAFKGLKDEHVWKRPAAELLSIGELAGHVAYWEATRFSGEGTDLAKCRVQSPLIDARFAYYPTTLGTIPTGSHLELGAEAVGAELQRVHAETASSLRELNPDLEAIVPGWSGHWTYRESLKYTIFHVAYHTGQMYSIRHLFGETTPDN
jgi:uncharacterized damage-inducible protein DinB